MKALDCTRTVRLDSDTDKRIEARAAKNGRTASDLIRETLEREFADDTDTPGDWILRLAKKKPSGRRTPDKAFIAAYSRRHQQ